MTDTDLTQLPNSRKDAKNNGVSHYFTGKPCKNGHTEKRNTKSGKCVECDRCFSRLFRKNNPEYITMINKKYYSGNKEKILLTVQKYYEENKEYLAGKKKEHYLLNKEKYNNLGRENYQKKRNYYREKNFEYIEKNKEKIRAQQKRHRQENPEIYRQKNRNTKALRKGAQGRFTNKDVNDLLFLQKGKCANCKLDASMKYHVDHIMPIKLGGKNDRSNIQILCPPCNLKKNAKHPIDWAREHGRLL